MPSNGWDDQFLVTPPGGLNDRYAALVSKYDPGFIEPISWNVSYHDFHAATDGHYGNKWDASLGIPLVTGVQTLVKLADYRVMHFRIELAWTGSATTTPNCDSRSSGVANRICDRDRSRPVLAVNCRGELIQVSPPRAETCCNHHMSKFSFHEVAIQHHAVGWPVHDLRGLPSPLPLERALELVEQLVPGQLLCVLTPYYPWPLMDILASRGFDIDASGLADGGTRVTVRSAPTDAPTLD